MASSFLAPVWPRSLRSMVLWLAVALTAVGLAACGDEGNAGRDAAADTEEGDTGSDTLVAPKIDLQITVDPSEGNAPMPARLRATFGDAPKSELFLRWEFGDNYPPVTYDLSKDDESGGDDIVHTYDYKGVYTIKATATWRRNNKVRDEASATIVVSDPVALRVSQVQVVSPTVVGTGSEVKVSCELTNSGAEIINPFAVDLYLSATDEFAAQTSHKLGGVTIPNMGSGKENPVKLDFAWDPETNTGNPLTGVVPASAADGYYYVFVVADPEAKLGDLNRADNAAYATSQVQVNNKVALPSDLLITAPDFDDSKTYSPGDPLIYQHEVKNFGPGESKASKFAVFLSADAKIDYDYTKPEDDPAQGDLMLTKLGNSTLTKIAPNATLPLYYSVQFPQLADGEYYLLAAVDVLNTVVETDETNNQAVSAKKIVVKKKFIEGVDMALNAMTVKPKGTYLGGTIGVEYTVQNKGNLATTKGTKASVFFCSTEAFNKEQCAFNKTDFTIPALAAGETLSSVQVVTVSTQTPIQDWYIWLRIDPDNTLAELNEGNNVLLFKTLKVSGQQNVDLAVKDVGFHPEVLQAGEILKYGYAIANTGTTGSGATTTWIALSKDGSCSASAVNTGKAILIKELINSGVDALDEVAFADTLTIPLGLDNSASTYQLCVVADAKNALTKETNKANNAAVSAQTLTVQGAKGGCFEDQVDLGGLGDKVTDAVPLPKVATELLGSCGDEDWWKIEVPVGHSLLVTLQTTPILSTSPVPSALDLDLVGPDQSTLLDTQRLQSAFKKASALVVAAGGTHYIRVYGAQPGVLAQYQLSAQVLPPVSGVDLLAGSLQALPGATFPGSLIKTSLKVTNLGDAQAGPMQVRYWLSKDGLVSVDDLLVQEVALPTGVTATQTAKLDRSMVLPVVPGGQWFLLAEVDAANTVQETDEQNNIAQSNVISLNTQVACETDAFSGNHTSDDAASVPPGGTQHTGLSVCPGLPDWYAIDLPAGKALSVGVDWAYQAGKGIVGVQILDASATGVLAGSAQIANTKAVLPYTQLATRYYIHIYVLPESGGGLPYPYGLNIQVGEPDPTDVCLADYYEPNNSAQTAQEIGCGLAQQTLCLGDEDWFAVAMQKDETINFDFTNDGNAMTLRVFANPNLPALKTQATSGAMTFVAPESGTYWLQVAHKNASAKPKSFAYTLQLDGGKGVDLRATLQSVFPGQVVQGEDVYLTVQLRNECPDPAGGFSYGYYYSLDPYLDESDTLMSLRPVSAGLPGKSKLEVDDKAAVPPDAKPGPAYVIVAADATKTVAESQELNNADAKPLEVIQLCLEDALEPNGAPQIAKPLASGRTEELSLCPYDLDWYEVQLQAGEWLTVTTEFAQDKGDLDIRLYEVGKFGVPVASSATKKAPEQFSYLAPKATKYYLRVSGFAGEGNAYALQVCRSMTGPCVACADNSWCGPREICDPNTTLCTALPCLPEDATVTCDDANQCTEDSCAAGLCVNEALHGPLCDDGDACTQGETCAQGSCTTAVDTAVVATPTDDSQVLGAAALGDGGHVTVGSASADDGSDVAQISRWGADGALVWRKQYGQSAHGAWLRGATVHDGALVAVGSVALAEAPTQTQGWLLRVDLATGAPLLDVRYGVATTFTELRSVAVGPNAEIIAAGASLDPEQPAMAVQGLVMRLGAQGEVLWQTLDGFEGDDVLHAVTVNTNSVIAAVGETEFDGAPRGWLVRVSPIGQVMQLKTHEATGPASVLRAVAATSGGFVAVGEQKGAELMQPLVVRYAQSLAQLEATASVAVLGEDPGEARGVHVAPSGEVWVAGSLAEGPAAVWRLDANLTTASRWTAGTALNQLNALVGSQTGMLALGLRVSGAGTQLEGLRVWIVPAALDCDDGNACTADGCDAKTGCTHGDGGCDDSDPCTQDACDAGSGCVHVAPGCNDGDVCTTDTCVTGLGCQFSQIPCTDGNPCTQDKCLALTGCSFPAVTCDDGSACSADSCDLASGCTTTEIVCDDDNACTADSCEEQTGCKHTAIGCDDGNACTTDGCDLASGCTSAAVVCDDQEPCTDDVCDLAQGCTTTAVTCDDGLGCTTDACEAGVGCVFAPISCDDGDACSQDTCVEGSGCQHPAVSCPDGNACQIATCDASLGCGLAPAVCDDGSACTADSCDLLTGCVFAPVVCDDLDPCTDDSCDLASGCTSTAASCDDGTSCTVDLCVDVTGCTNTPMDCSDNEPCTLDLCEDVTGCTHPAVVCWDGVSCDPLACVTGLGCPGPVTTCDDGISCTIDQCDDATGCSAAPLVCDDGNACTTDACLPGAGCTHTPLDASQPCDLGGSPGACQAGSCVN